jgi:hypothetical protein
MVEPGEGERGAGKVRLSKQFRREKRRGNEVQREIFQML